MGFLRVRWGRPSSRPGPFLRCCGVLLFLGAVAGANSMLAAEDDGVDARKAVISALGKGDVDALKGALKSVVRAGGEENVAALMKMIAQVPETRDDLYWGLVEGVSSFTDRPALRKLGELVSRLSGQALSRDILYALNANKSNWVVEVLGPMVEKGPDDLKKLALRKLANVESKRSVDILLEVLEREEKYAEIEGKAAILWETLDALERLTRQKFGANSVNWKGWWERNRDTAVLGEVDEDEEGGAAHTGTVVDSLDRRRMEEFYALEKAPKKGVVVLSAKFDKPDRDLNNDHIERVLEAMGVPHVVVKRPDFVDFDLSETGAIVINCAQFHEFCICPTCIPGGDVNNRLYRCTGCDRHIKFSSRLSAPAIKKIKDFVKRGGYVFAEDWIVKELLEVAYPKIVQTGLVLRTKKFNDVDVSPAKGMVGHAYLKGIFTRPDDDDDWETFDLDDVEEDEEDEEDDDRRGGTVVKKPGEEDEPDVEAELVTVRHRWTIDDESWAFQIKKRSLVAVLLSSSELQKRTIDALHGDPRIPERIKKYGQGVVAFAFRPGKSPATIGTRASTRGRGQPGVVLQVLSHFGKQNSVSDEHLLQNILLNFLIDANVERENRAKRSGKD